MDSKTPTVSVVMPAFNAQAYIRQAIDSVRGQSFQDWELIVVDDCSTDQTRKLVAQYAQADGRIRLVENRENLGAAGTRNCGIAHSRGEYVALLDCDDYWHPQLLEKELACARQTGADIVYCSYAIVDEQGEKLCNDFLVPEKTDLESMLIRCVISCSTAMLRGQVARENPFPTGIYHEDIALWFRLLRDGAVARGVPEVLACYRQHSGSRAANKLKSACRRWTVYRSYLKLPFFKCVVLMLQYGYYGVLKFRRI